MHRSIYFHAPRTLGKIIYDGILNGESKAKANRIEKFVIRKGLEVQLMTIEEIEEQVIDVLAKEEKLGKSLKPDKDQTKSNSNMKIGTHINAFQQSRGNRYGSNRRNPYFNNKPTKYKAHLNKSKYGKQRNFGKSDYERNESDKSQSKRSLNVKNHKNWRPKYNCQYPSKYKYRPGVSTNKDVRRWAKNWDLQALVSVSRCKKCKWFGHSPGVCDIVSEKHDLRRDLYYLARKKEYKTRRYQKGKRPGKGTCKRHVNSTQITTKTQRQREKESKSNKNEQAKQSSASEQQSSQQANLMLQDTNQDSLKNNATDSNQVNIVQSRSSSSSSSTSNSVNSSNNNNNDNARYQSFQHLTNIKTNTSTTSRYGNQYSA